MARKRVRLIRVQNRLPALARLGNWVKWSNSVKFWARRPGKNPKSYDAALLLFADLFPQDPPSVRALRARAYRGIWAINQDNHIRSWEARKWRLDPFTSELAQAVYSLGLRGGFLPVQEFSAHARGVGLEILHLDSKIS